MLKLLKQHDHVILDDITDRQLWELGQDGDGKSLGDYAPSTIETKLKLPDAKARRVDHITLYWTGDLHSSYRARVVPQGLLIEADTKKDGVDLAVEFGPGILKWSDKNQDEFIKDIVIEELQNIIRDSL